MCVCVCVCVCVCGGGVIYLGVLWLAVVMDRETPDCGWTEMREEVENGLEHNKAPD